VTLRSPRKESPAFSMHTLIDIRHQKNQSWSVLCSHAHNFRNSIIIVYRIRIIVHTATILHTIFSINNPDLPLSLTLYVLSVI